MKPTQAFFGEMWWTANNIIKRSLLENTWQKKAGRRALRYDFSWIFPGWLHSSRKIQVFMRLRVSMGFFSPELSELLSRLPVAVFSGMYNNAYHGGPVFSSHLAPKLWCTCLLTEKKDLQGNENMDKKGWTKSWKFPRTCLPQNAPWLYAGSSFTSSPQRFGLWWLATKSWWKKSALRCCSSL